MSQRYTRADVERMLGLYNADRVAVGLDALRLSSWAPGDRHGTRFELSGYHRVMLGAAEAYSTLNAMRQSFREALFALRRPCLNPWHASAPARAAQTCPECVPVAG